ncbi:MAG: glycerophosphodiester phosphodiesterase [Gammaproteobacteria bacterium]|nr:glycerophosphodiester phosphodiesterase [Gammaproteobacteria bacterium]MDD9894922.1 glycerophosphodiester phosphodiesterase [Gammaproteobacteria bacterium]MDD9958822.1 glycerophosphodiester phosphodiesterase [Gammaproteobacteria bacterium]
MRRTLTLFLFSLTAMTSIQSAADKIVIAHRGASGYLPEHTLEAKAMAYGMGAHYIEQDVVMTKDDHLIVLHDITLDRTTDVDEQYPDRAREDGRYYAIDFTLEEIKGLNASEGFRLENGEKIQGYANRFPMGLSSFRVPTLEEEIQLIQGMNKSTGNNIGIYPEIKQPEFHRNEGKDISTAVVNMLKQYGYSTKEDKVFLQTFSFAELEIIKNDILPMAGININLIQLIGGESSYPWMFEAEGMHTLAEFADGIGPEKGLVISRSSTRGNLDITPLVERAHAAGLQVHPYTYRLDPGQVPAYAEDFEDLLRLHYFEADVDGLFTDFPDRAVQFLQLNQ